MNNAVLLCSCYFRNSKTLNKDFAINLLMKLGSIYTTKVRL